MAIKGRDMSSNEHLDMSGNWADLPMVCHHCGEPLREENAFGCASDADLLFCSEGCVFSWEDAKIGAMLSDGGD